MLPLGPVAPPKRGRSGAHAASAAFTFALDELNEPLVPVAPVAPALGRVGKLTPCSFRQLRYAVSAVLLTPPRAPPKKPPLGRRLAQAANAFANFEFPPPNAPLGPVAPRRNCGAPPLAASTTAAAGPEAAAAGPQAAPVRERGAVRLQASGEGAGRALRRRGAGRTGARGRVRRRGGLRCARPPAGSHAERGYSDDEKRDGSAQPVRLAVEASGLLSWHGAPSCFPVYRYGRLRIVGRKTVKNMQAGTKPAQKQALESRAVRSLTRHPKRDLSRNEGGAKRLRTDQPTEARGCALKYTSRRRSPERCV